MKKAKLDWYKNLEEYIKHGEPEQAEKGDAWRTAIGLQDVDRLKTSQYLLETAKEHIEGRISINDVESRIVSYYEERSSRQETERSTKEADIVSSRIAALLMEKAFIFSPAAWKKTHEKLFAGVFDHAGKIRTYNISKKEWVLNGKSVIYAPYDEIMDTLEYDFETEKNFSYRGLSLGDTVKHISKFTCDIWQIHPFCEGNTRSTAVLIIKYLKSLGYTVTNDMFAAHSWYFRNALVRANYTDYPNDIESTDKYLNLFFENLLMGSDHELKNRYLHVDYEKLMNHQTMYDRVNSIPLPMDANQNRLIQNKNGLTNRLMELKETGNITEKNYEDIKKLIEIIRRDQIITADFVMEEIGCKTTKARKLLRMMENNHLIQVYRGKGKGRYILNL